MPRLSIYTILPLGVLLMLAAVLSVVFTPKFQALKNPPILESLVLKQFGEWHEKPSTQVQVSVNTLPNNLSDVIYDQVLLRTYQDQSGNQIMLAIAYAGEQRQEIKIHQPEVCYPAQGFQLMTIKPHLFNLASGNIAINGKQLMFNKANRIEVVSYWIRLGNIYPKSGFDMRLKIFKEGLKGNIDDGVLVRVSSIINDPDDASKAYQLQEKFLFDLVNSSSPIRTALLVPDNRKLK
jgi:EpsI family protein